MRLLFPPARLAAGVLLIVLAGCGSSRNEAYIEKPVDDLYNKAMDSLVDERYADAAKTFEQVESQHPYSAWATKSQLMGVYSLYEAGNYDQAIIAADRFIQLHPGHRDVAYAYYLKGICYYIPITDVGRDQKTTELALKSLDDVVRRFPDSKNAAVLGYNYPGSRWYKDAYALVTGGGVPAEAREGWFGSLVSNVF